MKLEVSEKEFKRLFVAVTFHPGASFPEKFRQLQKSTFRTDLVNWVQPDLLHLTLKFLGETDTARLPDIVSALKTAVSSHPAFSFTLDRIGAFGSRYQPRVVWLGAVYTPKEMIQLHNSIELNLLKKGFPKTIGNYVCHLTLARIRRIGDKARFWQQLEACQQLFDEKVEVRECVLYESILHKGYQPKYVALERFPLAERI